MTDPRTTQPRWPGESVAYREARDALTEAEHELSRALEAVAARRRSLPTGGAVPEDYVFSEGPTDIDDDDDPRDVRMSALFGPHGTLMLYSFMLGDEEGDVCRMCTSLIDGYDGAAPDLGQRVAFAVVAPASLERLRAYGRERRWRNVRLVSCAGTSYAADYGGQTPSGELTSRMNVFTRRDGPVRHFYASEKAATAPGEDDRHLDLVWALWGALDLTPEGRGDTWRPNRPERR